MARKISISFLGTNDYTECVYELDKQKSSVVKYVQSALAELFVKEGGDKYLVFTTQGALTKNWQGLQEEIKRLTPNVPIENVFIPDGQTVDEIWQIFQAVFDQLEDNDELTVDITHSFRSLPLLASALLQYAKFLKNVSVKAIYYGAFETLGTLTEIKQNFPDPKERIAPVFDLTAFSEIQDWSTAANEFITFGNPKQLNDLTRRKVGRLVRQSDSEQTLNELNGFNKQIEKLSGIIKTNRGEDIIRGDAAKKIIAILSSLEQNLIPALNPILEKIKVDVQKVFVAENDAKNMLAAVEWCIDKQLIQEGFTILQEGIITLLLQKEGYRNRDQRQVVSSYLQHPKDFENKTKLSNDEVEKLVACLKTRLAANEKAICQIYSEITDTRNDINHAGMSGGSRSAEKFETKLRDLYERAKTAFGL